MDEFKSNPDIKIGHIHLTVSDLDESLKFYRDLLGFRITSYYGDSAVFLSSNDYHHQIALNTWSGKGAPKPPRNATGLYHFAILYPDRTELARVVKRLYELNFPIAGASDHGVSESVYLLDPDNNGVELYADRPEYDWPRDEKGDIVMDTQPLDLIGLLSTLDHEG